MKREQDIIPAASPGPKFIGPILPIHRRPLPPMPHDPEERLRQAKLRLAFRNAVHAIKAKRKRGEVPL